MQAKAVAGDHKCIDMNSDKAVERILEERKWGHYGNALCACLLSIAAISAVAYFSVREACDGVTDVSNAGTSCKVPIMVCAFLIGVICILSTGFCLLHMANAAGLMTEHGILREIIVNLGQDIWGGFEACACSDSDGGRRRRDREENAEMEGERPLLDQERSKEEATEDEGRGVLAKDAIMLTMGGSNEELIGEAEPESVVKEEAKVDEVKDETPPVDKDTKETHPDVDRDVEQSVLSAPAVPPTPTEVTLSPELPDANGAKSQVKAAAPVEDTQDDAVIGRLFQRYDIDESGTLNTRDEFHSLTLNLLFKIKARQTEPMVTPETLGTKIDLIGVIDDESEWTLERYMVWFKREFPRT